MIGRNWNQCDDADAGMTTILTGSFANFGCARTDCAHMHVHCNKQIPARTAAISVRIAPNGQ